MREVLREETGAQARLTELSARLQATQAAMVGFLRILEREEVSLERLPETLAQIAERHREALRRVQVLDWDDPQAQAELAESHEAIAADAYDRADALLAAAEEVDLKAIRAAEVLAREAHEASDRRRRTGAAARAKRRSRPH